MSYWDRLQSLQLHYLKAQIEHLVDKRHLLFTLAINEPKKRDSGNFRV